MWYEQSPSSYAKGLRYGADRSDESAKRYDVSTDRYAPREAIWMRAQARRLRAMALLCDESNALTAGDIDFHNLHDPSVPKLKEWKIILHIERAAKRRQGKLPS